MASRKLSLEEIMALLGGEEEEEVEEEVDDPQEVIIEGSDEEFDVLDENENGMHIAAVSQVLLSVITT